MKIIKSLVVICLLTLSCSSFAVTEPKNIAHAKQDLIRYYNSGNYDFQIEKVYERAKHYLMRKVRINNRSRNPKKLAVVMDIDETVLSNYKDMKSSDFGSVETLRETTATPDKPAIKPALSFYKLAKNNGVAVFFVTGRYEELRTATEENLKKTGYGNWDKLFLKADGSRISAITYKTKIRKLLTKQGYDIVLNIGDQYSDLAGGFAAKTFKLPNPFYFIG